MGKLRRKSKGVKKVDKSDPDGSSSPTPETEVELKVVQKEPMKKKGKRGKKTVISKGTQLLTELLAEDDREAKLESDALQGYKVVKWRLSQESEAVHHLFIKKHTAPIAELTKDKPPGRTILCQNVPPYLSEVHLKEIFRPFGNIGKIFIHQKPTISIPAKYDFMFPSEKDTIKGFKVAYIVFTDTKHVNDIMELSPDDVEPVVLKSRPFSGVRRWMHHYNRKIYATTEPETSVRKFMESFDKEEVKRKEMEKQGGEPDEEGWVTVTRTGKRASGGLVRSEAMEERLRAKKRRQDKQLLNITPAQVKESKMKRKKLLELKKKFEEDKQRVALLKQQRKFKPF